MRLRILAAHCARGLPDISLPSPIRGRRECRVRAAPAVSCANSANKAAHEHTGQRRTSDIPCAMALRLITCSPRRTAFCLRCALGSRMPPGAWTPASRRQDHTSLPYAKSCVRLRNSASIATRPTSVTTADALLIRTGWPMICLDSTFRKTEIFFISGLDTTSVNRKRFARRAAAGWTERHKPVEIPWPLYRDTIP